MLPIVICYMTDSHFSVVTKDVSDDISHTDMLSCYLFGE